MKHPTVELQHLDNLWFRVTGTRPDPLQSLLTTNVHPSQVARWRRLNQRIDTPEMRLSSNLSLPEHDPAAPVWTPYWIWVFNAIDRKNTVTKCLVANRTLYGCRRPLLISKHSELMHGVEEAVLDRYSAGAQRVESGLCCPVSYDRRFLEAIPDEVLECDYGCGDPTRHVRRGETVLDLGSGSGKACFILSQVVGPAGRVIGVDMNEAMLNVARRNEPIVAKQVGYSNVSFRKGKIQDLALDLELLEPWLELNPVRSVEDISHLESEIAELRQSSRLIADSSIDVVVSNCVLNLVRPEDKHKMFREIFRVLCRGGRAVISDIVSDEEVPPHLQTDPELWSGCISGALREDLFLREFEEAGFYGISIVDRQTDPWRTVEGVEFRSMTVVAYKGKEGPCLDQKHAVVYRGPFRLVKDDDGHVMPRGIRTAVCEKTFGILSKEPYREQFELIPPRVLISLEKAPPFQCASGITLRDPRETKGDDYEATSEALVSECNRKNGKGSCC
jgi:arsenite methyltransferase